MLQRPQPGTYAPYFDHYISLVTTNDILAALEENRQTFVTLLESIPASKWGFAYAPGKWTLRESIIHVLDTERIFTYRALRIARGDKTPLLGFDHDDYVANTDFSSRTPTSIIAEFDAIRAATQALFASFPESIWTREGTASNNPATPLALAYMTVGHCRHHIKLTEEKYLVL